MIQRLVEADYAACVEPPSPARIRFWLAEARTPDLLLELSALFPVESAAEAMRRPLLLIEDADSLERALLEEEWAERAIDREYWLPLLQELEILRHPRP